MDETSALLKLGVVFMATGLMPWVRAIWCASSCCANLTWQRLVFIQAAWVFGGLYVGFILQAMGADFYPRLTAVAKDNTECNRLVNEQAEVGLLIAGPGVSGHPHFCAAGHLALFYSANSGRRWKFCVGFVWA